MNIAILGYGLEGQAAYSYWRNAGHSITVCDKNIDLVLPDDVQSQLGGDYLKGLDGFDVIVRSPGIHPGEITTANDISTLRKVTSVTNEFLEMCPSRNIIGVTGTKGKGTTCTLITRMLEAAGKTVHLGGNIGTPALNLLGNNIQPDDWVVLELSSFQLIDLKSSPNISVCLMVVPEHLNWHKDMAEYVTSKQQLFVWQTYDDIAIFYPDNEYSATIASAGNGAKVPYCEDPGAMIIDGCITIGGQEICDVTELQLLGEHNWQNACAAVTTAWQITHSVAAIKSVLTSFAGLPHRLELVRELDGVKYYNDSFASTPDASIAALQAIPDMKIVIVGGFDRNLPIDHFAHSLKQHADDIRKVLIIGASSERLSSACKDAGVENMEIITSNDMQEIVKKAQSYAETDDAILLSPGFASFDMFKNFEDRGNQFKDAVNRL